MTDESQLTIGSIPFALPEDWEANRPITAADLRHVQRNLEQKRMPSRTIVKLAINVQEIGSDLPSEEEVASVAAELYQQAVHTIRDAGGKTQRVREWKTEIE